MVFKVEFEMNPHPRSESTSGMEVRIEVEAGNSVVITGTANGQDFEGVLVFKKKKPGERLTEQTDLESALTDECWINGKWYNPCPSDPPSQDLNGIGDQAASEGEAEFPNSEAS